MQDKILRHAVARRVVEVRHNKQCFPDELRPPNMPADCKDPWPEMIQNFVFERPRQTILDMTGGPLTVTFNVRVDRSWFDFAKFDLARLTEEG